MKSKTLLGLAAGAAALCPMGPAAAQDYFIGQTIIVGFNYCPMGTLEADGSQRRISTWPALYAVIGTTFGGDGQQLFGLPDLRGRSIVHVGQRPGFAPYVMGQLGGTETVTLSAQNLPAHTHQALSIGANAPPNTDDPKGATLADFPDGQSIYSAQNPPNVAMATGSAVLQPTGNGAAFSNLDPYLTLRVCIVAEGIYPPPPQ